MSNMNLPSQKDSRWLQLEVCREAQRNKCTRTDEECKFAHPPPHVEIQNGRVVACYDSIKGRCSRDNPPCKYYHPPQHLKEQLLINGRNHLTMKNIMAQQQMQPQLSMQHPQMPMFNPMFSPLISALANPNLLGSPSYLSSPSSGSSMVGPGESGSPGPASTVHQNHGAARNRIDRLEVCREFARGACRRSESECRYAHPAEHVQVSENMVVVCMDSLKGKCGREACRYFHPPAHLVQQLKSRQSVNSPATPVVVNGNQAVANAVMGLPVQMSAPVAASAAAAAAVPSFGDLAQTLQAAASNPLLALLQQQQTIAAMLTAIQSAQASSLIAAQPPSRSAMSVSPAAATAASPVTMANSVGLKRKASVEQDSDLVFHGLAASAKRQTVSPQLSQSQFALLHHHQQQQQHHQNHQALAMMMNPALFQQPYSLQSPYHPMSSSPGAHQMAYQMPHGLPPNIDGAEHQEQPQGSLDSYHPASSDGS